MAQAPEVNETREIPLGALRLGGANPLFLIAGPCVIESEAHACSMAEKIVRIAGDCGLPYIFKASYDKANRSSINGFRGPGMQEGLRILAKIKKELGVPVLDSVAVSLWGALRAAGAGAADMEGLTRFGRLFAQSQQR